MRYDAVMAQQPRNRPALTPQGFADWLRRAIEDALEASWEPAWWIAEKVSEEAQQILESAPMTRTETGNRPASRCA